MGPALSMARRGLLTLSAFLVLTTPLAAKSPWHWYPDTRDEPAVLHVKLRQFKNEYWALVTLVHDDTGPDHFVDKFSIIDDKNRPIHTRYIEQPRLLGWPTRVPCRGIRVPAGVFTLIFRAHCKIHGYGTKTVTVDLTKKQGPDHEIVKDEMPYTGREYGNPRRHLRRNPTLSIDTYW